MNLEWSAPCHFSSPSWFCLVLESQRSARAEDVYILDNFPHLKTLIREKALGCVLFHFWIRISDRHSNWLIAKVLHSKGNSTACQPFNEVHNMCLTFFIIHELNQHFWHGYARQTFSKMLARYCFTIPTSSSYRFPLSFFPRRFPDLEVHGYIKSFRENGESSVKWTAFVIRLISMWQEAECKAHYGGHSGDTEMKCDEVMKVRQWEKTAFFWSQ